MDVEERRRAADALRSIRRGGEGWYSLSDAVLGRPAPRDEVVARLADLIDPGEDVSVSAYDLLSEEDREALWWVHSIDGGLDAASGRYREADYRRIELCSALCIDSDTGWSDAMAEMLRRLMPEGYEWPRYESGEPVPIGGEFMGKDGKTYTAKQIQFIGKCFSLYDFCDRKPQFSGFYGECVKRPAVLAADGEPLEVGQTVWLVDSFGKPNKEREVSEILRHDRDLSCTIIKFTDGYSTDCGNVTHERPVPDADGVPIHEGDTVWFVGGSEPAEVAYTITADASHPDEVVLKGYEDDWPVNADKLTHAKPEPPDTWERIEEDAKLAPGDYIEKHGRKTDLYAYEEMPIDLVRRCKALAERERGE